MRLRYCCRGTLLIKNQPDQIEITLRVVPGASKNEVAGLVDNAWKVRLTAPPVDGRANKALIEFLADKLGVKHHQIVLRNGETSRRKTIAVYGLDMTEITRRLGEKSSRG